jgi:hypothetical protein
LEVFISASFKPNGCFGPTHVQIATYITYALRQYYRLHLDKLVFAVKRAKARAQGEQLPRPQPAYKGVAMDAKTVQEVCFDWTQLT